jgi:hypothetical protein
MKTFCALALAVLVSAQEYDLELAETSASALPPQYRKKATVAKVWPVKKIM